MLGGILGSFRCSGFKRLSGEGGWRDMAAGLIDRGSKRVLWEGGWREIALGAIDVGASKGCRGKVTDGIRHGGL